MAIIKIGVAGYMGSGKSTCAEHLIEGGGIVIDADSIAKDVMDSSPKIKKSLLENFGSGVVSKDRIVFDVLGEGVFRSMQNLRNLNSIVHPLLLKELHSKFKDCGNRLCILDAALIPYWKIEDWFDKVYWIKASEAIRFQRIVEKYSITSEELNKRIKLQRELFPEPYGEEWVTIPNEGTVSEFKEIIDKNFSSIY